jgi:hypothetical protein
MQKLVLLTILAATAFPAQAARRVTVEQLHQFLSEQQTANRPDTDTATRILSLELTERLTDTTRDHLIKELNLGQKTTQTLDILADTSAFLDPPATELPATAPPDLETQRAMLNGALHFVATTLMHLPDFLATRTTRSFDDAPLVVGDTGFAPHSDLHLVGTFNRNITYRSGREVAESQSKPAPDHEDSPHGASSAPYSRSSSPTTPKAK